MLQQFLRTASDGWDLALVSVRNLFTEADLHADEVGGDFAGEAARLGHRAGRDPRDARRALPDRPRCTPDEVTELATACTGGSTTRWRSCPSSRSTPTGCAPTFDHVRRMRERTGPADPRRPAPRPDAAHRPGLEDRRLRGRAGQAAGRAAAARLPLARRRRDAALVRLRRRASSSATSPSTTPRATSSASTAPPSGPRATASAFLEAYAGASCSVDEEALLAAYVADKAVYEAVYETRNRPTWVSIPMAAIARFDHAERIEEP